MTRKIDNERTFYVVQFIELPFEGIDNYVCVPYTWLIVRKPTDDKAYVAYPKDEDPFTIDRVKRKERYSDEWKFYMVSVKYESNSYNDAELWITTRNEYGPLVEEVSKEGESKVTETQPKLPVNNKLRSAKQKRKSKSKKKIDEKRLKLDESAQSSSAVVNDAKVEPRSSKTKQSVIIQDNQAMECSQAKESSVASYADESSKTPHTEQTEQALSLPVIDVDECTEVIKIDDEEHSQRVKKPDQNNSMSQANSSSNIKDVSMTAAKPSTSAEQSTQPNQYNHQECIPDRSLSNFQPQIENVRSHMNGQPPVFTQSQSQNNPQVLRTHTGNSRDQTAPLRSIGMIAQEIHGPRINFETSNDLAAGDPRNVLQSVNNAATTSQQLPSLSHKPPSCIRRSDGHQNSVPHDQYYTHSYQNQYLPNNQDNIQQKLLRGIRESNTDDHRPTSQTIKMRNPSIRQNSTHLSNPMYQTPEVTQQRRMQQNQLNSQHQPQIPKQRIGFSIKPKDRKQMPTLQGVTKKTLSTTRNNFLSNNPQLQARMSPRSTGYNNVDLTTRAQKIASETSDRQNTERPSRQIYQPSRVQHTTVHENGYQNLCTQKQLVDQSTQTNSKTKRVHFMDDAARSPVNGSLLNVMDNACQTDECMVDETPSPYLAVTSDSDAVTDQEEISDREMSTDESPIETTNNVYDSANDPEHGSTDIPTAAQNSTARSHQINPKIILEQQMLDNFATLFTQMGTTLRYTTDMYNTLRCSILDTAAIYKKLLGAAEQFNTAGNTASNASPSSNLRTESPRSPEARNTKVTASASSSNQDQHNNEVANKTPKKNHKLYRFVLPPEYDAYDTRWTLKYRTNLPGLVELMPQSGVYVSQGDLNYCQQVSKDCKSLARRLLPQVFNRNALSICSSMSETAQASKNVGSNIRPDLDVNACSVLLNFVLEHGLQRAWNTDIKPILSTLHSQMQEIRFKYGVMVEC